MTNRKPRYATRIQQRRSPYGKAKVKSADAMRQLATQPKQREPDQEWTFDRFSQAQRTGEAVLEQQLLGP